MTSSMRFCRVACASCHLVGEGKGGSREWPSEPIPLCTYLPPVAPPGLPHPHPSPMPHTPSGSIFGFLAIPLHRLVVPQGREAGWAHPPMSGLIGHLLLRLHLGCCLLHSIFM